MSSARFGSRLHKPVHVDSNIRGPSSGPLVFDLIVVPVVSLYFVPFLRGRPSWCDFIPVGDLNVCFVGFPLFRSCGKLIWSNSRAYWARFPRRWSS